MERFLYKNLLDWKNRGKTPLHKPLLLLGAKGVGKKYLLEDFGKKEYKNYVVIDCKDVGEKLLLSKDTEKIINTLSDILRTNITNKTLIILSEVKSPVSSSLAMSYDVVATSSYCDFDTKDFEVLHLYPLSFMEFLKAVKKDVLFEIIKRQAFRELELLKEELSDILKIYCFVGGLPEIVDTYAKTRDFDLVRAKQIAALKSYEEDFLQKAITTTANKMYQVFFSIPKQLAKENKKFSYNAIKQGSKKSHYEKAIAILERMALVHKVLCVKEDRLCENSFKFYMLDTGLFSSLSKMWIGEMSEGVAEQFFVSEFFASNFCDKNAERERELFYYTNENSTLKIDFLIKEKGKKKIFVETGISENKMAKNLCTMLEKDKESSAVRFLMNFDKSNDKIENVHLALCSFVL